MRMLDLFAGRGGASAAMRDRGWDVTCVDIHDYPGVDVVADIREWNPCGGFDLVWASPPCTEFSRESMPWCRTGATPSMELVKRAMEIIKAVQPRYWVIENVRGAVKYLRDIMPAMPVRIGACYLWNNFYLEPIACPPHKERITGKRPDLRSVVPYVISEHVAATIEACERGEGVWKKERFVDNSA